MRCIQNQILRCHCRSLRCCLKEKQSRTPPHHQMQTHSRDHRSKGRSRQLTPNMSPGTDVHFRDPPPPLLVVVGTSQPGVFVMTAYRALIRPSGEDAMGRGCILDSPPGAGGCPRQCGCLPVMAEGSRARAIGAAAGQTPRPCANPPPLPSGDVCPPSSRAPPGRKPLFTCPRTLPDSLV